MTDFLIIASDFIEQLFTTRLPFILNYDALENTDNLFGSTKIALGYWNGFEQTRRYTEKSIRVSHSPYVAILTPFPGSGSARSTCDERDSGIARPQLCKSLTVCQ